MSKSVFACLIALLYFEFPYSVFADLIPDSSREQVRLPDFEHIQLPLCIHDMVLTGTVTGNVKSALISIKNSPEKNFAIGQTISPGIVLIAVYSHSAVIQHNGVLERLKLTRPTTTDDTEINKQINNEVSTVNDTPTVATGDLPTTITTDLPDNSGSRQSEQTKPYRVMGLPVDVSDFITQAKFTPQENGGLAISESTPDGIYERLGFENGDVLQSLSGVKINSLSDVNDFMQHNTNLKEMQVLLMRNSNYYYLKLNQDSGIEFEMVVNPAAIK